MGIEASAPVAAPAARPADGSGLLAAVACGTMLAPLNSTMIAVALPHLMREFGADLTVAGWLVTGYLVAMATLQPIAGKLGDRFGRRRLSLAALALFGVASVGAAVSPSLPVLLVLRTVQGVCGAIVVPNGTAMLRETTGDAGRGTKFGLLGGAIALAAAVGPPLGGFLDETAGWRALFWLNVPFVAVALGLGWRAFPASAGAPGTRRPFDVAGAVWLCLTLVLTARALSTGGSVVDGLLPVVGAGTVVACWILLLAWSWRTADPVLQPRYFQRRAFAASNAGICLSNLAMYTTLLALPQRLASTPGWTSATTGLALMAMSATMVVCTPAGGRLADRFGRRWPTVAGLAILTVGVAPLWLAGVGLPAWELGLALALAGVGLGLSSAGLQTSSLEAVEARSAGSASGVYSTSRYIGSIVGSSLLAVLPAAGDGAPVVFLVVTAAAALSTIAALWLVDRPAPPRAA